MSDTKENNQNDDESFVDDIELELEEDILEESGLEDKIKKLRSDLKIEKKQSQEYLTGWQTERASFANYKSEEEKKRKERLDVMKLNLVSDFFPVLDSFDMAFSNKESWEKVEPAWRSGVEYIYTQFINALEGYDVTTIDNLGVEFNPMLHEPVEHILVTNKDEDNKIITIIQKGYQSGERVLRAAKVKVGKFEDADLEKELRDTNK